MLVDTLLKRVQTECLVAFAHSRIAGVAGRGCDDGINIFNNRYILKDVVNTGKKLEDCIKDIATIETINEKISNKNNIGLANMYHHHYTKLLNLLDKSIPKNGQMIEGLIGLHIMILATQKGLIKDEDNSNIQIYLDTVALYENERFTLDESVKQVVEFMKEVSIKIFNKYFEKVKKGKKK
ncbi:MAG: hypothetical protein ACEQSQ_12045 [Candidatus Paceibacteria bacterium]